MPTPPATVSNSSIPDHIYVLPPNLASQPGMVRWWCVSCLIALTTVSKTEPTGTLDSFIKVLRDDKFCTRKGNSGACNTCTKVHKACVVVCFFTPPLL